MAAAAFTLFVLILLPLDVMGERVWNEADVLPLARQSVDPSWMPHDWYLNQPPGYRAAFEWIAGPLTRGVGFTGAALIGRACCYALVAGALASIGVALGLRLVTFALAVTALLVTLPPGRGIAGEWFVGGFEAKSVAWGLVLWSVAAWLHGYDRLFALAAGVGASFHVLVGGWATITLLAALAVMLTRAAPHARSWRTLAVGAAMAAAGGAGAAAAIWQQLAAPRIEADVNPYFIYVFLRLPHHLNPLSWNGVSWVQIVGWGSILLVSVVALRRNTGGYANAAQKLALLAGLALVPFALGLAAALVDDGGRWLRFYPFRVGAVLLPLAGAFLGAKAVQRAFRTSNTRRRTLAGVFGWSVIVCAAATMAVMLPRDLRTLDGTEPPCGNYPNDEQAWAELCSAVTRLTPPEAIVVAPPVGGADFVRRSGRATVANFKLLPQNEPAIAEWYARITALAGGADLRALVTRTSTADPVRRAVAAGYAALDTAAAVSLMDRYRAAYIVTPTERRLDLPVVFENARYVLYRNARSNASRKRE